MSEIHLDRATCIGCGCNDTHACIGKLSGDPCHWLVVDYENGIGVCSECPEKVAEFEKQYGSEAMEACA